MLYHNFFYCILSMTKFLKDLWLSKAQLRRMVGKTEGLVPSRRANSARVALGLRPSQALPTSHCQGLFCPNLENVPD